MTAPTSHHRAVVLVRISDARDGDTAGVDRQETDCRALAHRLGLDVVAVLVENSTSAFKQRKVTVPGSDRPLLRVIRPKFRQALDMLWRAEADVLIGYDLDRTVRDPRDLEDLVEVVTLARRAGRDVTATSVTGSLRLDTDSDVTMARVMVALANKSSLDTARRVARKRQEQAEEGRPGGGPRAYGWQGSEMVGSEAEVVRDAARRLLAGESLRSIVRDLNDRHVPTATGAAHWDSKKLRDILKRPRNAGLSVYKGRVVGTGVWQPLLDREIWETVVALLADPDRRTTASTAPRWLGSSLYRCACGAPLRSGGPVYRCSRPERGTEHVCRRARLVDRHVIATVLTVLADQGAVGEIRHHLGSVPGVDTEALAEQIATARAALDRNEDAYVAGAMSETGYRRNLTRWQTRLGTAQARLLEARQAAEDTALDRLLSADDLAAAWEDLSLHEQREVIRTLATVTLRPSGKRGPKFDPDSVTFTWTWKAAEDDVTAAA
jgi:site-specific DNA recombinase